MFTVTSKILQLVFHSKIGDIIVIPAAISFVLAILFSISKFTDLMGKENGIHEASIIAFWACLAIVSFQIAMILLVGHHNKFGIVFIILFFISVGMLIYKWMATFS